MSEPGREEPLPDEVAGYLAGHHVMSLATAAGGDVWAASVFYCFDPDGTRLLYYTDPATRHGRLALGRSAVAATVSGQQSDVAALAGIQLEGDAELLDGEAADHARDLFAERFPEVGANPAPIWALHPSHISLTDNSLGFGHKVDWRADGGAGPASAAGHGGVRGMGVDMVDVDELARLLRVMPDRIFTHIFAAAELADADRTVQAARRAEQLAIRFAVKEAVFKAIAHLLPERFFDMRVVESLNEPDGYLRVRITPELREVLDRAGVEDVQVSATTENQYVTVVALAQ